MYARRYVQAQNETASRERLMVLLIAAALRHIRAGAEALESALPGGAERLTKALDIVTYLDATFDRARYPELADNLGAVYRFTSQRLVSAAATRTAEPAREAERVFAPIADAFTAAVEQLAAGAVR